MSLILEVISQVSLDRQRAYGVGHRKVKDTESLTTNFLSTLITANGPKVSELSFTFYRGEVDICGCN